MYIYINKLELLNFYLIIISSINQTEYQDCYSYLIHDMNFESWDFEEFVNILLKSYIVWKLKQCKWFIT
jgi:hypothetical protein